MDVEESALASGERTGSEVKQLWVGLGEMRQHGYDVIFWMNIEIDIRTKLAQRH